MNKDETKGWICPKCGRVYAPWVDKCQYCGNSTITYTHTPQFCPYWTCSTTTWASSNTIKTASTTSNSNTATLTAANDSTIERIKEGKGLSPPVCDNENHTSGITYI